MLAFQCKARALMIEARAVPGFGGMAEFATVFFDPMLELSAVRVGMAALTRQIRKSVACVAFVGGLYFRMTSSAGYGQMASGQRIACAVVKRQIERAGDESVNRMAFLAGSPASSVGKLPAMPVAVAIRTARMGQRFSLSSARMALYASDSGMFPLQRKCGAGVIEGRAAPRIESLGGMTLRAMQAELPAMCIVMTIGAGAKA